MKFTLGLDVHKQTIRYALVNERGIIQDQGTISTNLVSCGKLLDSIPESNLIIGMEASTYIYPIYDFFKEKGYIVKVANPQKLHRITKAFSKNDAKDAIDIALQLLRNDFPESYMLTPEMRDKRELIRQHFKLTQEQTRLKNQIYSHLARYNLKLTSKLGTYKSFEELETMPLNGYAKVTLKLLSSRLKSAKENLKLIYKELEAYSKQDKNTQALMKIDGIGLLSACTFILELGDYKRFKSVEDLTAYVGLIPKMLCSGGKVYHGRMRRDGNKQIKYIFTRAAEIAIRASNQFQDFYNKLKAKGKKRRTIMAAVANNMLRTCYGVLNKEDQTYQAPNRVG